MVKVAPPLIFTAALLFAAISPALADSVTLTSGEEIQGTILRETDSGIVMELHISSGVTDQRTFAKSEIRSVIKTPPDELAYQKLSAYKVGPNSYTLAGYESILGSLKYFCQQFPQSPFAQRVQQTIDALKAEKARVATGEMKWNNRWYSKQEATQQKYQIQAGKLLAVMKEQAARADIIGALNTFDHLEQKYPGSSAYPDAVELALVLMPRLQAEMDRAVTLTKFQEQQFTSGIDLVSEPEKSEMIAAHKRQIDTAEAAIASAEHANVKWKPLYPITEKSPAAIKATLATELPRLRALSLPAMRNSIAAADAAFQEVAAKNFAGAEAKMKEAQTLWAPNEALLRLAPALVSLKAELAATPTPTPSPTPIPASPAPATAKPKSAKASPASRGDRQRFAI